MTEFSWPELTAAAIAQKDLSAAQTGWAMDQVMGGEASPIQLAGFLTALATKGETSDEVQGFADSMLSHATPISVDSNAVDIVGTGGDRAQTVNISTMASLVIAGAGIPVVKHGNRASSSRSGSADFIEAMGVNLAMPIDAVAGALEDVGITFLFANLFHPSMKYAATARRELAVGTVFNILGPLTNPARVRANAIGVSFPKAAPVVAGVLAARGNDAMVFRGKERGLDEITTSDLNEVWLVHDGTVSYEVFDAQSLGFAPCSLSDLKGGDPQYNASVGRDVLAGKQGPITDAVLLNAAAAVVAYGSDGLKGSSLTERMSRGVEIARESLFGGKAADVIERWVNYSREHSVPAR